MRVLFVGLLALVAGATAATTSTAAIVLETFAGVAVDPCVHDLWASDVGSDCTPTVPQSAATITLSSARSPSATAVTSIALTGTSVATLSGNVRLASPMSVTSAARDCAAVALTLGQSSVGSSSITAIPADWHAGARELEDAPRKLCVEIGARWVWTGVYIATAWDCEDGVTGRSCADAYTATATATLGVTAADLNVLKARTQCCRRAATGTAGTSVGTCINPNLQKCCGGSTYEPAYEKCCAEATRGVQFIGSRCLCSTDSECASTEGCCKPSKFSDAVNGLRGQRGECFGGRQKCCDTGAVYDSATEQCCSVNGVQSLDEPCPCHTDAHCASGEKARGGAAVVDSNKKCCRQTQPELADYVYTDSSSTTPMCSVYNNYPTTYPGATYADGRPMLDSEPRFGQGPAAFTRCTGVCVDTRFQICCNGVPCIKEFEKCCNATCCNKWSGTCSEGRRSATEGNAANWRGVDTTYWQCTTVEALTPFRALLVFVIPVAFLFLAFAGLAVAVVFAGKAPQSRAYNGFERAIMFLAAICMVFAAATFFSPAFKYGVFIVMAMLVTFIAAAIPSRILNAFDVLVLFVLVLYLLDPFHGNQFLTTASDRTEGGTAEPEAAGVLHTVTRLYQNQFTARNTWDYCTTFYGGYFELDSQLRDLSRMDNMMEKTFGYCSRGWIVGLLVFETIAIVLTLILFICSLWLLLMRSGAKQ